MGEVEGKEERAEPTLRCAVCGTPWKQRLDSGQNTLLFQLLPYRWICDACRWCLATHCERCGAELTSDERITVTQLRKKRRITICDRCRRPRPRAPQPEDLPTHCERCGSELTNDERFNATRLRDQRVIAVCDKCRGPQPRATEREGR